ncbi:MAG TPA: hypothetical protein VLG27_04800, partial [Candidatus Saccharimonadia bacterium]|nr:hypothetical protein [Candidatus Saccharimonadia bacterium]
MADKKAPESAEEEQAIKKIDAMMSMNEKDGTPAVSTSIDTDKFKKAKTAPKLPEVYKPKETAKPPIVIKLADDKKPDPAVTAPAEPAPPKPDQPEQVDAPAPGVSITPDEPAGSADIEDSE